MKLQHARVQIGDSTFEEVCLLINSDEKSSDSGSSASLDGKRKVNANKVISANKPVTRENDTPFCFSTILDSGTEWTIVVRPAWSVCKTFQDKLNMSAVDGAMNAVSMHLCGAMTAIQNKAGQTRLFWIYKGIHSTDLTNDESVVNDHLCCGAG
eukprot:15329525-Ditylum_brightwellii.AAC.1